MNLKEALLGQVAANLIAALRLQLRVVDDFSTMYLRAFTYAKFSTAPLSNNCMKMGSLFPENADLDEGRYG